MPFGLKNAEATYQWMMTRMFLDKIGRTIEVYIDDMVVKSKQEVQHIKDLQGVFEVLRQHKLRLNVEVRFRGRGWQVLRIFNHRLRN